LQSLERFDSGRYKLTILFREIVKLYNLTLAAATRFNIRAFSEAHRTGLARRNDNPTTIHRDARRVGHPSLRFACGFAHAGLPSRSLRQRGDAKVG
jgi:hypothetical protein